MFKHKPLLSILPLVLAITHAFADENIENSQELEDVVVTAVRQDKAGVVQFKTKTAIQPLPANDGASVLLTVPNMNSVRKGGTSGDPLFRGLGGSRLSVQADDHFIYGGCGGRMDPPTAYIYPDTYDKVIVTKGPQTVTQGMGLVSGSVEFVREDLDFSQKNFHFNGAYTAGSFKRHDIVADAAFGGQLGYARLNALYNRSGNYKDGNGNRVHSEFERNSQMLQLGLTPTANTLLSATYDRSRAEAAYAALGKDGVKFDRDAWNIHARHRNIYDWFTEADFRFGQSKVDHVMDNYSMRPLGNNKPSKGNPKRKTDSAHFKTTFDFNNIELQTGVDYMNDKHSSRMGGKDYATKPFNPNQSFKQWGAFAEANWASNDTQNWIFGYRHDNVKAKFHKKNQEDTYRLDSGFVRFEQKLGNAKYYIGLGTAERSPDFWERNRSTTLSPERNNQLDAGVIWHNDKLKASASLFASRINNFILIDEAVGARNIDANRFGGEAELAYQLTPNWKATTSIAYTYGKNHTDHTPLAQTPPLEWKTSINWDKGPFSVGALWRVVSKQNRFVKGQGSITGQDIGASAGFGVLSVNGAYQINKNISLQAGVDNVLNKNYSEFLSKSANPYLLQTERVNEPGRQFWLRLQGKF